MRSMGRLLTWRQRGASALAVVVVALLVVLVGDAVWSESPPWLRGSLDSILITGSLLLLFVATAVWWNLFRTARETCGLGYALGHVALSMVLTPVLYTGVLFVPLMVESDVRKGVARWRSQRHETWWEKAVSVLSGIVAVYFGGAMGILAGITLGLAALASTLVVAPLLCLWVLIRLGRFSFSKEGTGPG